MRFFPKHLSKLIAFGNTTDQPTKQRMLPLPQVAPTGQQTKLDDLSPHWWFSPLQPVAPMAPAGTKPRQWAYAPAANIIWQPKVGEVVPGVTFETLRELADAYDILRLVIETRKDQICTIPFSFRAKQKPGEETGQWKKRQQGDKKLAAIAKFFEKPDGLHDFKKWMRMWLEDMLVVDAVALYLQRDNKDRITTIHPVDGATIGRIITEQGFTPPPDQPAYQQVIYGVPACDLTVDELAYSMRNERTCRRYGYSRVEQILLTINLGLQRKMWQLDYYVAGSVPDAFVFLPPDLPIEKVEEAQTWFDSIMSGQSVQRRKVRFMPGYGTDGNAKPNVIFPKEPLLKDTLDEWLAQVVCYAFSISPQAFMKMMNRATAKSAQESSEEEGIEPDKIEVLSIINGLMDRMGFGDDYECVAEERKETDAAKQASIDVQYCPKIRTVNEVRADRGWDPYPDENADKLGSYTATGAFVALGEQPPQPGGGMSGGPGDSAGNRDGAGYSENDDPNASKALAVQIKKLINGNGHDNTATLKLIAGMVKADPPVTFRWDNFCGIGADDDKGDPDFVRMMTPDEYLGMVLPVIGRTDTSPYIESAIRAGEGVASPSLTVSWDEEGGGWQVTDHDGRHRMMAVQNIDPQAQVPVRVYVAE